jgi:hypothetical protein
MGLSHTVEIFWTFQVIKSGRDYRPGCDGTLKSQRFRASAGFRRLLASTRAVGERKPSRFDVAIWQSRLPTAVSELKPAPRSPTLLEVAATFDD